MICGFTSSSKSVLPPVIATPVVSAYAHLRSLRITGDSSSVHSAFGRLSAVLQRNPYGRNVEDAIYLLALGWSIPALEHNTLGATSALEYLEYIGESYALAKEGAPTAMLYPHWDTSDIEDDVQPPPRPPNIAPSEGGRVGGLQVDGLPIWALHVQTALLAFRLKMSSRGMAAMENAFFSYEAWLPRYGSISDSRSTTWVEHNCHVLAANGRS